MDIDTKIAIYAAEAVERLIEDISSGMKKKIAGIGFLHGTTIMGDFDDLFDTDDGSESYPYWCWYKVLALDLKGLVYGDS